MLFGVMTLAAILLAWLRPERPPPPFQPRTVREKQVLALAHKFVRVQAPEYRVPIMISPHLPDGSFLVTYWTPRREWDCWDPAR